MQPIIDYSGQLGRLPNESEVRMLKDLQIEFDKIEGQSNG